MTIVRTWFHGLLLASLLSACGGSDSDDTGAGGAGGTGGGAKVPSEATLCKIVLDETTPDQAVEILGDPFTRNDSGAITMIVYLYGDQTQQIHLKFADDKFAEGITSNIPFPDCWKK